MITKSKIALWVGVGLLVLADVFFTTLAVEWFLPKLEAPMAKMVSAENCGFDPVTNRCAGKSAPHSFPSFHDSLVVGVAFTGIATPTWGVLLITSHYTKMKTLILLTFPVWIFLFTAEIWIVNFCGWFIDQPTMMMAFKVTSICIFGLILLAVCLAHTAWLFAILPDPEPKLQPNPKPEETPLKTVDI